MGNCLGITGVNPNSEGALNFASSTIVEVFERAKDAYDVAHIKGYCSISGKPEFE